MLPQSQRGSQWRRFLLFQCLCLAGPSANSSFSGSHWSRTFETPCGRSILKHVMPVHSAYLLYCHGYLPHSPPSGSHLPASPPIVEPLSTRLPDEPSPSPQLSNHPAHLFAALAP